VPGTLRSHPVVVTGGTGGLGVAVVEHLLAQGAEVTVPFPERALAGPLTTMASPRLTTVPGVDLGDERAVERFYAGLPALWASVHLAGGFAMAPLVETSLDAFRAQQRLNLETCFLCCREAARTMRARPMAGAHGGRMVNVCARPALEPVAGMTAYAVAKAGVAALTRLLGVELVGDDILVNAVVPSIIDTPANRRSMPDADFSRWPRPAELARTIAHLVDPATSLTSGALVPVYGKA
jgi:NAD(P)-dependent dehydrogenase (short-subunit alcohol dehydrogenase family)